MWAGGGGGSGGGARGSLYDAVSRPHQPLHLGMEDIKRCRQPQKGPRLRSRLSRSICLSPRRIALTNNVSGPGCRPMGCARLLDEKHRPTALFAAYDAQQAYWMSRSHLMLRWVGDPALSSCGTRWKEVAAADGAPGATWRHSRLTDDL